MGRGKELKGGEVSDERIRVSHGVHFPVIISGDTEWLCRSHDVMSRDGDSPR